MSLKDSLIQQTEQAVDGLRKRRITLETELEGVRAEEQEARDMLTFLKNGKPPEQTRATRKQITADDARLAIEEMPDTFTTHEYADLLEISKGAAANWLRRLMDEEALVKRLSVGRGNNPSMWEKN